MDNNLSGRFVWGEAENLDCVARISEFCIRHFGRDLVAVYFYRSNITPDRMVTDIAPVPSPMIQLVMVTKNLNCDDVASEIDAYLKCMFSCITTNKSIFDNIKREKSVCWMRYIVVDCDAYKNEIQECKKQHGVCLYSRDHHIRRMLFLESNWGDYLSGALFGLSALFVLAITFVIVDAGLPLYKIWFPYIQTLLTVSLIGVVLMTSKVLSNMSPTSWKWWISILGVGCFSLATMVSWLVIFAKEVPK